MNFGRGEVAERLQCMSDLGLMEPMHLATDSNKPRTWVFFLVCLLGFFLYGGVFYFFGGWEVGVFVCLFLFVCLFVCLLSFYLTLQLPSDVYLKKH